MKLLILICLWIVWCSLHSALISVRALSFFRQRLKARFRYFRLGYNGFALVSMAPVLIYSRSVPGAPFFFWGERFTPVYVLLWAVVIFLGYQGARAYDLGEFSGLRQLAPEDERSTPTFFTHGILGVTRHPWYLAGLIFLWIRGRHIHLPMVAENTVLSLYLLLGTGLEERKLIRRFGAPYLAYRQRVSALIPFKWAARCVRHLMGTGR